MALDFIGASSQPAMAWIGSIMGPFKPKLGPIVLPKEPQKQRPTPTSQIQKQLESLKTKSKEWANLDSEKKEKLFRRCSVAAYEATEEGAQLLADAKGSYGHGLGEERMSLLSPIQGFREYADSLAAKGKPAPKGISRAANGQYVVEVFPTGYDSIFFGGFKGEVWIQPGKEPTQGAALRAAAAGEVPGSVAMVLGAGNQIAVAILDIAHVLAVDNAVVICKMNPTIDYLRPYVDKALAPLTEAGYVEIVFGGAEQGKFLTENSLVNKIHLTGSAATYDAIVWQGQPKSGVPPLKKPITAELGCVTPCIVTPGKWSKSAIQYHAEECAASLTVNAGHNCCKLEVIITAKDWPQRQEFMQAVKKVLDEMPRKVAWYPGSAQKKAAFKRKFPKSSDLGVEVQADSRPEGYMPWSVADDLDPAQADLTTENWCGVLQEVALPGTGDDSSAFLKQAVDFANNKCWGSLSCTLLAPPDLDKSALELAVQNLRYGAICVNLPAFAGFAFTRLSWGAFPGNKPEDIGSGDGFVHNTLLLDHPQKSVIYAPWIHYPTHLWNPKVKNLDNTSYYAVKFQAYPGLVTLNMAAMNAIRG